MYHPSPIAEDEQEERPDQPHRGNSKGEELDETNPNEKREAKMSNPASSRIAEDEKEDQPNSPHSGNSKGEELHETNGEIKEEEEEVEVVKERQQNNSKPKKSLTSSATGQKNDPKNKRRKCPVKQCQFFGFHLKDHLKKKTSKRVPNCVKSRHLHCHGR